MARSLRDPEQRSLRIVQFERHLNKMSFTHRVIAMARTSDREVCLTKS
jgi:hypothetical protein